MRYTLEKPRLGVWIITSVALHLGIAILCLFVYFENDSTVERPIVVPVHIVQKGPKRDEKLLPRIVQEEPKVEAPEPTHETKPTPPAEEQKHQVESKPKPPPKPHQSTADILKRVLEPQEKEGNPDALEGGNSVFGELTDQYTALVAAKMKDNFRLLNTMTDREKKSLKILIRLRIDSDGHTLSAKIIEKSKSADYDEAVLARIDEIPSFGAPPIPLRKQLKKDGLDFYFCPLECK